MSKRLTDNEFHTKESKERACYIQEPRLQAIYDKLFELEDIEEELGIDLMTFFKYLNTEQVFYKEYEQIKIALVWGIDKEGIIVVEKGFEYGECEFHLYFKDYGTKWALTKKELEK